MSNFNFLKEEWPTLYKFGHQAESYLYSDPSISFTKMRQLIEELIRIIFTFENLTLEKESKLVDNIRLLEKTGVIEKEIERIFHSVRREANEATHEGTGDTIHAIIALKKVYMLSAWFMETYVSYDFVAPEFIRPQNKERLKDLELIQLRQQLELKQQEIKSYEEKLKALKDQIAGQSTTEREQERIDRRNRSKAFMRKANLSESETRVLFIDEQLRQAGWEVDSEKLDWRKGARPEKNKNMAIAEVPTADGGRADYGLFIGLDLVGVVEAKKYAKAISGDLTQAKGYAEEIADSSEYNIVGTYNRYKVPFLFSSNGRPYLKQLASESGIWFWDARTPKKPSFALENWHSPEDLKQKLEVSEEKAIQALKEEEYPEFANRHYQIEAVKAVEKGLEDNKRRMLLAMATGTGKTRLALSLMYRLIKTKRVRRVLFLVDRRSLGIQAEDALKDTEIDHVSFASLYDVKGVTDVSPEETTRIQIATVQGMVRRLFNSEDENQPSVGTYDFIIVDEAHRGYTEDREMTEDELYFQNEKDYVSQYRRVIDYFDATVLGLTATPALHTTEIFGEPIYTYSYSDAVIDGYLVDHDPPYKFETELSKNGIHFDADQEIDVWNDNDKTIDKAYLEDELNFDVEDFNKKVISEGFNRAILDKLSDYIDPEGAAKTLIFAATDKHADSIVQLLKESYAKKGEPVDDDAIMKITGVVKDVDQWIKRFKNEQYPNVVVTVDLLTTGIDVPEIENLVFMRRVRSRILYDQMLGRATRLCPKNHKSSFKIFDAVHLYDYLKNVTDMRPVVANPNISITDLFDKAIKSENEEEFTFFKNELIAKLQRKKQRLSDDSIKEIETLNKTSKIDDWIQSIKTMSQNELERQFENIERIASYRSLTNPVVISNDDDEVIEVTRGYGEGNEKPADYLQSFERYIRENVDKIEALRLVVSSPKDLTYQNLREIQLILKEHHFDEKGLQEAWRQEKQELIAADIISFIRQVALGTELIDHETRIKRAMQKVYGMEAWTPSQMKWLNRIEMQLLQTSVLAPTAERYFNETEIWKRSGGYKKAKINIGDRVDEVIDVLNTYLYQV